MKLFKKLCLATALCLGTAFSANASQVDAIRTMQDIYLDDTLVSWKVYNVNDQNYVRLADLCPTVGTSLLWDSSANAVRMTSGGMTPEKPNATPEDFSDILTMATAYQDIIARLKSSYGSLSGSGIPSSTGLYFSLTQDFDGDGVEELVVSYISNYQSSQFETSWTWNVDVYNYLNGQTSKIHSKDMDFVTGSTANFGTTVSIVTDGTKFYLSYLDYTYHMYSNSESLSVYDFSNGKENLLERIDYTDTADNAGTTFTYSITTDGQKVASGTFKKSDPTYQGFHLLDYGNHSYSDVTSISETAITRTANFAETDALLARWATNPQTKEDVHAVETKQTIYLDDKAVDWLIYNVNDENYIRLADLCPEIGVGLTWDSVANAVRMTTDGTSVPVAPQETPEILPEPSMIALYAADDMFITFNTNHVIDDGENWIINGVISTRIYKSAEEIESLKKGDTISYTTGTFHFDSMSVTPEVVSDVIASTSVVRTNDYTMVAFEDDAQCPYTTWMRIGDETRYYLSSVGLWHYTPMTAVDYGTITVPKTVELLDGLGYDTIQNPYPSDIFSFYSSSNSPFFTLNVVVEQDTIVKLMQLSH